MDLNKKTMQRLLLLITFALVLHWALDNPGQAGGILSRFLRLLSPFLLGLAIAFIANVLLRVLEGHWPHRVYGPTRDRARRPVCLVLTLALIVGVLFAVLFIVLPSLKDSVALFADRLPTYLTDLQATWEHFTATLAGFGIQLPTFNLSPAAILTSVQTFFQKYGQNFLNSTLGFTSSLASSIVNLALAVVFSLYVLAQKETLGCQCLHVLEAIFSEKTVHRIRDIAALTGRTFASFITGQLTEAVILGSLCFVGMLLFRFPYASVISVLIGFTALIPIFGAFIGIGFGAFLILLVSPGQVLWFVVFILVLQQIEGNLIYPRVVGKSVGLPGIWVLAAVTIGGNAFGLTGMLVSVPTCSVLYTLAREAVQSRLGKRNPPEAPGSPEGETLS